MSEQSISTNIPKLTKAQIKKIKEDEVECCKNCHYSREVCLETSSCECHRSQPSVISDVGSIDGTIDMGYAFPYLPLNEWCGEYKRKVQ